MFRIALLALIVAASPAAIAQPTTDAAIDAARADIARFCASEIQAFVKIHRSDPDEYARRTPEQLAAERIEYLFGVAAGPPDVNYHSDLEVYADELRQNARNGRPPPMFARAQADIRLRICVNGRAQMYYGDRNTNIVVQNRTKSPAKLVQLFPSDFKMTVGVIQPGATEVERIRFSDAVVYSVTVDDAPAYGPTTVQAKPGETIVLTFGDDGNALAIAQPPSLD